MQDKQHILLSAWPEQSSMHNLPAPPTPLVDREQEITAACSLLRCPEIHLLTLTGTAGIGKTRLALQVAIELRDDFADGIYYVSLASIHDPELVIPTIAQTLGLSDKSTQPLFNLLTVFLQEKHLLLLLDNFEQILPAAPLLADLLATSPGLKLLVTSREVLHLRAEQQFRVPPLTLPNLKHLPDTTILQQYAAVALFLQRVRAVKPDFQLTLANAATIAEICVRLDGLPLAIELAAARMKFLSPQALLARLDRRLQVLTGGARDLPERQQTLRNMIKWSYELLKPEEQQLFRRLSVFVGGCTLQAIEAAALGDEAESVLDGVTSLIDKSLVQQTEEGEDDQRLTMLETIREYGLECLSVSGEMEATRHAHADYYLALAQEAEPLLSGPQQAVWFEKLEREHDNLRAAMQWSIEREDRREMALRLGGALRRFWQRGYLSEGRTFLERALSGSEGIVAPMRTKALISAARVAYGQGDYEHGETLAEQSLALCRELGDTQGIAYSLYLLAWTARDRGHLLVARALLEESLALYRKVDDKENIAWDLYELAVVISIQGEYTTAHALLEESLTMHREQGNKAGIAGSLYLSSWVFFITQGDTAMVRSLLAESAALFREVGDKECIAWALSLSGQLTLGQGDVAMAHSLLEESIALFREIGHRWGITESLSFLAKVFAIQGNHATARALYEESLALARKIGYQLWIAPCLEGLAGVIAAQGEPISAARLWGAAETLRESMGAPMPPVERATYEQAVASARRQVGKEAFAAAWAEGRKLTPEQALAAQGQEAVPRPTPIEPALAPPAKVPATYPTRLTTREVEVLRLLAKGLTSAEIAAQLTLSLLTVNTHVRSIYSKLGVTSRSAATRWAMEHQLV